MRPGARRDPRAQPEPEPLVGHPARTMLRTDDVVGSSQLAYEERSALAEVTCMTMHGTMIAMQVERHRAPTAPVEPEIQRMTNDFLNVFDRDTLLHYAIMAHDAYFGLHRRCRPRPMGQVYLYCHHLIVVIRLL